MSEISTYKISGNALSEDDQRLGILQAQPVMGNSFSAIDYFDRVLPWYNQTGRLLTPAEMGCSLAHQQVWQKIVDAGKPGLILEDDIAVTAAELKAVEWVFEKSKQDYINFGVHPMYYEGRTLFGKFDEQADVYIIDPYRSFHGAFAYGLTPTAASELLRLQRIVLKQSDLWDKVFHETSAITPAYAPLIFHPKERGSLQHSRKKVSFSVHALNKDNIRNFIGRKLNGLRNQFTSSYSAIELKDIESYRQRLLSECQQN